MFTPPEISYDPQARRFVVVPPPLEGKAPAETFGLQLAEVSRAPFRLQLVGFMEGGPHSVGLFENRDTTELMVARAGARLSSLEVTILDFEIRRERRHSSDHMDFRERVAFARVRDERTGEEVTLTDREQGYAGPVIATVVPEGLPDERHPLRPGETLDLDEASYQLERAELTPPRAELVKRDADETVLEKRILTIFR